MKKTVLFSIIIVLLICFISCNEYSSPYESESRYGTGSNVTEAEASQDGTEATQSEGGEAWMVCNRGMGYSVTVNDPEKIKRIFEYCNSIKGALLTDEEIKERGEVDGSGWDILRKADLTQEYVGDEYIRLWSTFLIINGEWYDISYENYTQFEEFIKSIE